MALEILIKPKCPLCRKIMRFKAFVGFGNVQGWECVLCQLIVSNACFKKLEEAMFARRLR